MTMFCSQLRGRSPQFRKVINFILAVLVALLASPYMLQLLQPAPATICLVNLANNPRTASLFSRGVLEQHGSKNTFDVVSPTQGCHLASERILLVQQQQLMDWCLGPQICILTGDEECHAPGLGLGPLHEFLLGSHLFPVVPETAATSFDLRPPSKAEQDKDDLFDELFDEAAVGFELHDSHGDGTESKTQQKLLALQEGVHLLRPSVILREFYSSKYDYPAVVLGARFEFVPVSEKERDAGNRHYLFNFMGSIKVGQERDREHLRDVLNSHNWTMPTHVRMFDQLVRNPDTSTVEEYRDTLLASSFTLAPVGTADDCFRFWEAIEAGSIPIFVRRMGNAYKHQRCPDAFEDVLAADPPIVLLNDWDELPDFAEHVTEEQIDDLRRRMVVWAKEWWTKTAAIVDDAIERALVSRNQALAELTDEQLEFRTKEVSSALHALKEQQSIARRSSKVSAMENKAVKQKEAQERRQKQKIAQEQQTGKHPLSDDVGDDIGATELDDQIVAEIRSSTTLNDEQIEAAISSLREEAKKAGGGTIEATQDRLASLVTSSKVLADADLRHPTFEWVHSVAVSIIESCGYHRNSFVELELDGSSVLMQYPVNRVGFLNKLITSVASDLKLPPLFVNAQNIIDRQQAPRTRLFLCLLAEAAQATTTSPDRTCTPTKTASN
eukprot:INCI7251.9.p1 GENE.INCI7251.9~~INCI7251.9.p1  ORF type:complete len:669 (-),score=137.11 INCI7251.9:213-2219(-)